MDFQLKHRSKPTLGINKLAQVAANGKSKGVKDSSFVWILLACARVYLASVQTGYIHPDEFHQSLQVMAHDILGIQAQKPWEFQSSAPIRSVTFSSIVSLPFFFIKYASPYVSKYVGIELLTPSVLLMAPRLFMTLLSFIADFCVYRIAKMCYLRPWQCVEVFASSYVMLVYATRTFSNSLELILQAVLLWRVCESMVDTTKVVRKEGILQDLYEAADNVKEKVKYARLKSRLPAYNYVDSGLISVVVTYGTFVRPTFLVFSFVPVTYWLQRGVVTREVDFSYFNLRCMSLVPGVVFTTIICVLCDSFYYGSITILELLHWNVTVHSFVVTPINFFLYNTQSDNLATHGLHPYYLHLMVNVPILFGVLGVVGMWSVSTYVARLCMRSIMHKPKVHSMATMLLLTFSVPTVLLSCIPHQEPRFLLPLLLPLVILHSDKVILSSAPNFRFTRQFFFTMWHGWNIFSVILFGFLHQGGVTKTLLTIHHHIADVPTTADVHVVFAHMYTPPTYLLMRRVQVVTVTEEGRRVRLPRSVISYDAGGSRGVMELYNFMSAIHLHAVKTPAKEAAIILCLPASLSDEVWEEQPVNVTVKRLDRIRGHLTLEDPPNLQIDPSTVTITCNHFCRLMQKLDEFSIDMFRIQFKDDHHSLKEVEE